MGDNSENSEVKSTPASLERGRKTIRSFAKKLPETAGVYRMLDSQNRLLYVGKAKNLRRRVMSYSSSNTLSNRKLRMVAETNKMEVAHTSTEVEALLLEANMIRHHKPRYNVLLRDDKMVPYIKITDEHDYPKLVTHRGKIDKNNTYYGPFASAGAVYRTIDALQKVFQIRNCSESKFKNRSRPCLQYHIKRCSAPCVNKVSEDEYAQQIKDVKEFLEGGSDSVRGNLQQQMKEASDAMDYEVAAVYRDRLQALAKVQTKQDINVANIVGNADVIAIYGDKGRFAVQVFFFRNGCNFGNQTYFPRHTEDLDAEEVLRLFIVQFYHEKEPPSEILLSHELEEQQVFEQLLREKCDHAVTLLTPKRGDKTRLVSQALDNAKRALARRQVEYGAKEDILEKVKELFDLSHTPERIEIYDNSHISGSQPVGAMVVATPDGFDKGSYRKFNIKDKIAPGDDYAMMREVMRRRFSRVLMDQEQEEAHPWPDLVLIDGGKGQLSAVMDVINDLEIEGLNIVAISKGEDRNAGRETFHQIDKEPFQMPERDPVLYYLQTLRDEAHRFAVGAQRTRRKKKMKHSRLDDVPGVGGKRKKALLLHFGSAKAVETAAIEDLMQVEGVSEGTAEAIYNFFH